MGKEEDKEKEKEKELRERIVELWLQGRTHREIATALSCSLNDVKYGIKLAKLWLNNKTVKKLEYRKNRVIAKIERAQGKAWGIFEAFQHAQTQLSALRVVKELHELEAKVEGVIAEKLTVGPDKAITDLMKELQKIETEGKDNGHKEKKEPVTDAQQGS